MSRSSFIHARIEPDLKKQAEKVLQKLGMTPSQLITMIYTEIADNNAVPLKLKIPNKETRKVLDEADKGKNLHKAKDIDDLFDQIGL